MTVLAEGAVLCFVVFLLLFHFFVALRAFFFLSSFFFSLSLLPASYPLRLECRRHIFTGKKPFVGDLAPDGSLYQASESSDVFDPGTVDEFPDGGGTGSAQTSSGSGCGFPLPNQKKKERKPHPLCIVLTLLLFIPSVSSVFPFNGCL